MSLELKDIQHLAKLSKLALSPAEETNTLKSMNHILGIMEQLQSIDTTDIEPLAHPISIIQSSSLRLREDEVTETTSIEKRTALMSNAPAKDEGLFLVPRVIE
ncbi:MAG: Asp-tRNA(Asn)/Glu-tRNA(Gln) amidotransferase subunit GatC [Alcaligenaceae bacterium]|nr:Asp-tRNA(Asn)/Glu-tRNA(Gln) amidotransferase subunit GatC [Alcaligenaceae bacterium]